jgi:MraZ protein
MFLGTHEPKLDEKGRIILPARFRDELAKGLVITKGQERRLYVFPVNEFSAITDRLRQAPVTEKAARDYMRVMFAGAHDEVPDKQDAVTIPSGLRIYAGLERVCRNRRKYPVRGLGCNCMEHLISQIARRVLQMYRRRCSQDSSKSLLRPSPIFSYRRLFPGADGPPRSVGRR